MPPKIEIVCCSAEDCVEAEAGGADRIELCAAISVGGLTPSIGTLIAARAATRLPIMAMLRPRAGGFCYSDLEFESMERDLEAFRGAGAEGVVFGILDRNRQAAAERCSRLVRAAGPMQTVFHRAFDVALDPLDALRELIDLGFTRVLTSGQAATAMDGVAMIRKLREVAEGKIEVLPAGGIRSGNVRAILGATGCDQVHLAPFVDRTDGSLAETAEVRYGTDAVRAEHLHSLTDRQEVARLRAELRAFLGNE